MPKNRIIVCGSRGFTDYNYVKRYLDKLLKDISKDKFHLEIVSGHCPNSPDMLGERYAKEVLGFSEDEGLKIFPADWERYKKAAGHFRNIDMSAYATHCVAFWDGKSIGTRDMIFQAELRELVVRKVIVGK